MTLQRPLFFEPRHLAKRWGDAALLAAAGLPAPQDPHTGESWLISDVEGFESPLRDDPEGRHLGQLMQEAAPQILGEDAAPGTSFPLLIKALMAGSKLSVQVHPDGPAARALGVNDRGKHEAWWVLAAGPDARIYRGLKAPCSVEDAAAAIRGERFQELLRAHEPREGELYEIPPGTFHGCGDGLVMLEVQERCDVTFRVYDWGREGTELHIDQALQVGRLDGQDLPAPAPALGAEAPFVMLPGGLEAGGACAIGENPAEVLVWRAGEGRLHSADGVAPLSPGDAVIWPDALPAGRIEALTEGRYLRAWPKS